jgi:hypothetical protein
MATNCQLIIENRTRGRARWPDWFVQPMCRWVLHQTGLNAGIRRRIIFRSANAARPNYWRGTCWCGQNEIRITLHRRVTKFKTKDYRFKWSPHMDIQNRLEMFVYLWPVARFRFTFKRSAKSSERWKELAKRAAAARMEFRLRGVLGNRHIDKRAGGWVNRGVPAAKGLIDADSDEDGFHCAHSRRRSGIMWDSHQVS